MMRIRQLFSSFAQRLRTWTLRKWLLLGAGLVGLPVVLFVGLYFFVRLEWLGPLPDREALLGMKNDRASYILAADGTPLGKYFVENRTEVPLEEVSPQLVQALIATEDARFYEHSGVDMRSLGRVAVKSVLLGNAAAGGGSTLSQQLAKNLFPRESYWLFSLPINKIREMVIASRLEKVYDKDKVLELYLNTVPFGENVFGIGAASQRFFQKSPDKLPLEKAAVLVGMLKATTTYNPRRHEARSLERRNVVLQQMVNAGFLDQPSCDSLKALPLGLNYRNASQENGLAPYLRQQAATDLKAWLQENPGPDGKPYNLFTDGLKIYTTIDPVLQQYAEKAVAKHMKRLQADFDKHWKGRTLLPDDDPVLLQGVKQSDRYKGLRAAGLSDSEAMKAFGEVQPISMWTWDGPQEMNISPLDSVRMHLSFLQAGFLAMEPKTGYIRAWVGGIEHRIFKYDHVTSRRQVGSTFKPLIYAAAIENGVDPCEYFPNEKVVYQDYDNWAPGNADGKYEGYYSLRGGLTHSVNTVSAAVMMKVGVNNAWNFVNRFGFESDLPKAPSLVLGTADLTLKEMVGAYSVFANRGVRSLPVYITKIEDANGRVLAEWPQERHTERVMETTQADMVAYMLQSVVEQGTASRLRRNFGIQMALGGKTGTTQDQTDGWFIGINPNLVVGAWVGGEARKIRFRSLGLGQGANTALPICGYFLQGVQANKKYRHIAGATFAEPGISALQSMDCALYEEQPPNQNGLEELMILLKQRRAERALNMEQDGGQQQPGFEEHRQQRQDIWDKILPRRRNR